MNVINDVCLVSVTDDGLTTDLINAINLLDLKVQ